MSVISQTSIIENLTSSQTASGTKATSGSDAMGKEAFLKLLVTQLQNQDPLNPMEGVEFTSQLAQFTSLEQLYNLNSSFGSVSKAIESQNNFKTLELVGKEVSAVGDGLSVKSGESTGGYFHLDEAAASVVISVYDETGTRIRTIDLGPMEAGQHEVEWDAKNYTGQTASDGDYSFAVTATGADDQSLSVSTWIQGVVTSLSFDSTGYPILKVNGLNIDPANVFEITIPEESEGESV
ncbi:MAG: flagellar hook assembly protein FlgD [Proteobacteria bacterium]|nr:flagellar hook assembly protein FlgD [Pseudomonadota bacterium]